MKKIFLFLLILNSIAASAQVSCDSFCIKDILIDSSANPNILKFTISFNGNQNDFINYPYISALTNSNFDTLGTGTLSFFGQIGSTDEVYEVNTNLDSIPTDFLIHFSFDTTTCIFNNLCNPVSTNIYSFNSNEKNIFFNPYECLIFARQALNFKEAEINLFDSNGRLIKKDRLFERFSTYNLGDLQPGPYIFQLTFDRKTNSLYFYR